MTWIIATAGAVVIGVLAQMTSPGRDPTTFYLSFAVPLACAALFTFLIDGLSGVGLGLGVGVIATLILGWIMDRRPG